MSDPDAAENDELFEDHQDEPGPPPMSAEEAAKKYANFNPHRKSRSIARKGVKGSVVGAGAPIPMIASEEEFNLANVMQVGVTLFANRTVRLTFLQAEAAKIANDLLECPDEDEKRRRGLRRDLLEIYRDIAKLESQLGETAEQIVVIRKGRGHEIGAAGEMHKIESQVVEPQDVKCLVTITPEPKEPRPARPLVDKNAKLPYQFRRSTPVNPQFRDAPPTGTNG